MALATAGSGSLTFSQHLVLWLHVAFVVFTIGPVTLAIISTPRYIRQRDVRIVRYLSRITFIFMLASLAVLIAGAFLAQMLGVESKPWIIVSLTLFVVAVLLLVLIVRDQRKAIRALEEAALSPGTDLAADHTVADGGQQADPASDVDAPPVKDRPAHIATMERGRIAMTGGLVSLIWLVILVLMVWNS